MIKEPGFSCQGAKPEMCKTRDDELTYRGRSSIFKSVVIKLCCKGRLALFGISMRRFVFIHGPLSILLLLSMTLWSFGQGTPNYISMPFKKVKISGVGVHFVEVGAMRPAFADDATMRLRD